MDGIQSRDDPTLVKWFLSALFAIRLVYLQTYLYICRGSIHEQNAPLAEPEATVRLPPSAKQRGLVRPL